MRMDWKEYFAFSKKDRVGATVLLILIVIVAATYFYNPSNSNPQVTITTLDQELAKQGIDTTTSAGEQIAYVPSQTTEVNNSNPARLFQFDPNTLDAAGFKQLGLPEKTINTILKYRSKGGHFWKQDDLRKIYSLSKEDADRLIPYVHIAGQQQAFAKAYKEQPGYTKPKPAVIDINTATVEQWKSLPAIGDVLSNRIVKFRDKIGGFTSIAQVKQTYGLSDSAFQAIEPYLTISATPQKVTAASQKASEPGKININSATLNQIKANAHIPQEIAQAIVIYRSQHGNFASIEDLKKIVFINEEVFRQIAPYISVD
jgi:competence protein ComEA